MIRCRNGHLNEDGATYCAVCKVYIDTDAETVEPEPEPPSTPVAAPPEPARPVVTLSETELTAFPGGVASAELSVQNPGEAGDEYAISVEGPAASWVSVDPVTLSLAPGASGVARVSGRPDASLAAPGPLAFAVRVTSRGRPDLAASTQGTLELARPAPPTERRQTPRPRWLVVAGVAVVLAVVGAALAIQLTRDGGEGGGEGGGEPPPPVLPTEPPPAVVPGGGGAVGKVSVPARVRESVPSDLSSTKGVVTSLPPGTEVRISCQEVAPSGHWDKLSAPPALDGMYINDGLLSVQGGLKDC
jgi:hypothetical protein